MLGKKTGGRKKGVPNKRSQRALALAVRGGMLPLDYMLKVMHDSKADPLIRADMAKAAAPYLHAKRAPEDREGKSDLYTVIISKAPEED